MQKQNETSTTPELEETYEQHVGGFIARHLRQFIAEEKIDKHGWTVKELEDGTVVCKPSQEVDNHSTNPFNGLSKEVLDFVFETPNAFGGLYLKENPLLTQHLNAVRLDCVITRIVLCEIVRLNILGTDHTVRDLLKAVIAGETGLQPPSEIHHYSEQQWNKLLDLAETYLLKTTIDLDEDIDSSWIYSGVGWLEPYALKLEEFKRSIGFRR